MTRPPAGALLTARAFPEDPDLTTEQRLTRFLTDYWGQRSLVLPGACADMPELLDGDELAGLACEPAVDARIVRRLPDGGFESEHGPFAVSRFDSLGDADWTLLVNGVDLEIPGFETLLALLRFVPDWRLDDIMVSFAAPGGSAGPHFDQYDVFLVQAAGTRRWEMGADCRGAELTREQHGGLDLVAGFEPTEVLHCGPGDVIYIPPGMVHHGIAETPCLTLSLGLRAPAAADLMEAWLQDAEDAEEQASNAPLALDPPLPADPARLAPDTIVQARQALRAALLARIDDDTHFARWLGGVLTRPGRMTAPSRPDPLLPLDLASALERGSWLERAPGARLLLHDDAEGRVVFVGGDTFQADALSDTAAAPLLAFTPVHAGDLEDFAALELATALYNAGWLVLNDPEE